METFWEFWFLTVDLLNDFETDRLFETLDLFFEIDLDFDLLFYLDLFYLAKGERKLFFRSMKNLLFF